MSVCRANVEIDLARQRHEQECSLLRAKLQKAELRIKALEVQVEQKQQENTEVVGICDELIKRMEADPK